MAEYTFEDAAKHFEEMPQHAQDMAVRIAHGMSFTPQDFRYEKTEENGERIGIRLQGLIIWIEESRRGDGSDKWKEPRNG